MKDAILYALLAIMPDGSTLVMDSHMTADECYREGRAGIVAYYDGESVYPLPYGVKFECEAMGEDV